MTNEAKQRAGLAGGRAAAAKYTHEERSERAKAAHRTRALRKTLTEQRIFRVTTNEGIYFVVALSFAQAAELCELCWRELPGTVEKIESVDGIAYTLGRP